MKYKFRTFDLVYVIGALLLIAWMMKPMSKPDSVANDGPNNKTQYEEAPARLLANKESAREVIGEWYDSTPYIEANIIIIKSGDSYLMKREFKDGSAMEKDLTFSKFKGKSKFSYESSSGSYMVIESSGHLGLYDSEGFITTATKSE